MKGCQSDLDRKKVWVYIILSYTLSWSIWIASYIFKLQEKPGFLLLNIIAMWTPAISIWITKIITRSDKILLSSMRPDLKENLKWFFIAWIFPFIATISGGLYGDFGIP